MVQLCADYSTKRLAFGKYLNQHPLHMQTLSRMEVGTSVHITVTKLMGSLKLAARALFGYDVWGCSLFEAKSASPELWPQPSHWWDLVLAWTAYVTFVEERGEKNPVLVRVITLPQKPLACVLCGTGCVYHVWMQPSSCKFSLYLYNMAIIKGTYLDINIRPLLLSKGAQKQTFPVWV